MSYERDDIKHLLKILGYSEGTHFTITVVDGEELLEWTAEEDGPTIGDLEELYGEILATDGSLEGRRWAMLREERTAALYRSDWTDLPNCQLSAGMITDYLTWRQELRDVPQDYPEIDEAEDALAIVIANEPTE